MLYILCCLIVKSEFFFKEEKSQSVSVKFIKNANLENEKLC